jgi:predicted nucleic acid-binding protein
MAYLLDTNVLCESSRARPDFTVVKWLGDHDAELNVSVLSLGEMLKDTHLMDQGGRRHEIEKWYQRIERWAAKRLLAMDVGIISTWGLQSSLRSRTTGRHTLAPKRFPRRAQLRRSRAILSA